MGLKHWLNRILTVDDEIQNEQFSLDADAEVIQPGASESSKGGKPSDGKDGPRPEEQSQYVSVHLETNKAMIEKLFHLPENKDIVIREFTVRGEQPTAAMIVFVDGLADKTIINRDILEPLMYPDKPLDPDRHGGHTMSFVQSALVPTNQLSEAHKWEQVTAGILTGSTALFVDGISSIVLVETKGWEHRSVSTPQTENVVRGPHDAFTESFRVNTGLVRAKLRSPDLVTHMVSVGKKMRTDVAVFYVNGMTNRKLVQEMIRRLEAIDVDYVGDSGIIEQYIEDGPPGLLPRILSTERPDRVAQFLAEGHVAIIVGHSPYALIAPITFWGLLHTPEDAYIRWPFGSMLRALRLTSVFIGLLLPALYIALSNYHPEMIPTGLLMAIAAARETVPFPVFMEVLMMELALELIREAGIRIPSAIGPTIGIVGALILGQAAVQAGIVSPILVIVVAVTALASFTMPNYNLSLAVRALRFVFLLGAAVLGFYGIILIGLVTVMHVIRLRSFGVPMLAPIAPYRSSSNDVIMRGRVEGMEKRSPVARPRRQRWQSNISRPWSPWTHDSDEAMERKDQKSGSDSGREPI